MLWTAPPTDAIIDDIDAGTPLPIWIMTSSAESLRFAPTASIIGTAFCDDAVAAQRPTNNDTRIMIPEGGTCGVGVVGNSVPYPVICKGAESTIHHIGC